MTIQLALIRQRYNPYGGAERFVASALEALQRQGQNAQQKLALTLITREWTGEAQKHRVIECPSHFVGRLWRDLTYAKVRLDEASLSLGLTHIEIFTVSLPRSMVLASAWDLVRDGVLAACL